MYAQPFQLVYCVDFKQTIQFQSENFPKKKNFKMYTSEVFKCNICGNNYSTNFNLNKHIEIHKPCALCSHVCLTNIEQKNHAKLHEVPNVSPSAITLQQDMPSTSAAAAKRKITSASVHPLKIQRVETTKEYLRYCEDCGITAKSLNWFNHCGEQEHKNNVNKSVGNRVNLLRSKFRTRIQAYRFLKKDINLNAENYLKEGKLIFKKLLNNSLADHVLIKFNLELVARYKLPSNPLMSEQDIYHISEMVRLSRADDIDDVLGTQIDKIKTKMSEFQERDSGWTLIQIKWLDININKASPIPGSQHIRTPIELANKMCCINVQNTDTFCFKWSIIAAFYNGENRHGHGHLDRPSTYGISDITSSIITLGCGRTLNFTGMSFPTDIKDIKLFEKNNEDISVNVFGYDRKLKTVIGPFHITKTEKQFHINLILLESECGEHHHYILIKNISR